MIGKCFIGAKTISQSQIFIGFYDDFYVFRFICGQQNSPNFCFFMKNFNSKASIIYCHCVWNEKDIHTYLTWDECATLYNLGVLKFKCGTFCFLRVVVSIQNNIQYLPLCTSPFGNITLTKEFFFSGAMFNKVGKNFVFNHR